MAANPPPPSGPAADEGFQVASNSNGMEEKDLTKKREGKNEFEDLKDIQKNEFSSLYDSGIEEQQKSNSSSGNDADISASSSGDSGGGGLAPSGGPSSSSSSYTSVHVVPRTASAFLSPQSAYSRLPLRLLLPEMYMNALIGENRGMVSWIADKSGASIAVLEKQFFIEGKNWLDKMLILFGTDESYQVALKDILEVLTQEAGRLLLEHGFEVRKEEESTSGGGGVRISAKEVTNGLIGEDGQTIYLRLLAFNSITGRLIGRLGKNLKDIMSATNTQITISSTSYSWNEPRTDPDRLVEIVGKVDAVLEACYLLTRKLSNAFHSQFTATGLMPGEMIAVPPPSALAFPPGPAPAGATMPIPLPYALDPSSQGQGQLQPLVQHQHHHPQCPNYQPHSPCISTGQQFQFPPTPTAFPTPGSSSSWPPSTPIPMQMPPGMPMPMTPIAAASPNSSIGSQMMNFFPTPNPNTPMAAWTTGGVSELGNQQLNGTPQQMQMQQQQKFLAAMAMPPSPRPSFHDVVSNRYGFTRSFMYCPESAIGSLIGPKGANVNYIRRETGVLVEVNNADCFKPMRRSTARGAAQTQGSSPESTFIEDGGNGNEMEKQLILTGKWESHSTAQMLIYSILEKHFEAKERERRRARPENHEQDQDAESGPQTPPQQQHPQKPEVKLTVEFYMPTKFVPRLIGTKGLKLQKLQKLTSTFIQFGTQGYARGNGRDGQEFSSGAPESAVRIFGSWLGVRSAQAKILEAIDNIIASEVEQGGQQQQQGVRMSQSQWMPPASASSAPGMPLQQQMPLVSFGPPPAMAMATGHPYNNNINAQAQSYTNEDMQQQPFKSQAPSMAPPGGLASVPVAGGGGAPGVPFGIYQNPYQNPYQMMNQYQYPQVPPFLGYGFPQFPIVGGGPPMVFHGQQQQQQQ